MSQQNEQDKVQSLELDQLKSRIIGVQPLPAGADRINGGIPYEEVLAKCRREAVVNPDGRQYSRSPQSQLPREYAATNAPVAASDAVSVVLPEAAPEVVSEAVTEVAPEAISEQVKAPEKPVRAAVKEGGKSRTKLFDAICLVIVYVVGISFILSSLSVSVGLNVDESTWSVKNYFIWEAFRMVIIGIVDTFKLFAEVSDLGTVFSYIPYLVGDVALGVMLIVSAIVIICGFIGAPIALARGKSRTVRKFAISVLTTPLIMYALCALLISRNEIDGEMIYTVAYRGGIGAIIAISAGLVAMFAMALATYSERKDVLTPHFRSIWLKSLVALAACAIILVMFTYLALGTSFDCFMGSYLYTLITDLIDGYFFKEVLISLVLNVLVFLCGLILLSVTLTGLKRALNFSVRDDGDVTALTRGKKGCSFSLMTAAIVTVIMQVVLFFVCREEYGYDYTYLYSWLYAAITAIAVIGEIVVLVVGSVAKKKKGD